MVCCMIFLHLLYPPSQTLSSSLPTWSQTTMTETTIKCISSSLRKPRRQGTGRGPYIHVLAEFVRWDTLETVCVWTFILCMQDMNMFLLRLKYSIYCICNWLRLWVCRWVLCSLPVELNFGCAQRILKWHMKLCPETMSHLPRTIQRHQVDTDE